MGLEYLEGTGGHMGRGEVIWIGGIKDRQGMDLEVQEDTSWVVEDGIQSSRAVQGVIMPTLHQGFYSLSSFSVF